MARTKRGLHILILMVAILTLCSMLAAQAQPVNPQDIPDAPSAQRPPQQFPLPDATVPSRPVPSETQPTGNAQPQQPPPQVKTVPPGGQTAESGSGRDELYKLIVPVNFVVVPVSVKNSDNRLVPGLSLENFSVYEDGQRQKIKFFTSDPFPISAAVVVDVGMADVALKRVEDTLGALGGAFGEFDEVAYYVYGNTVSKQQDFVPATSQQASLVLKKMKQKEGSTGGPPMNTGPMSGPTINGRPADPGNLNPMASPTSNTHMLEPSRVLNDALLRAAIDLSKRDRTRRKIIFIISEGREDRSNASFADVKKFLLTNEISVYAVAVDSAAIPGYGTLNKIRLPRQGYGNILQKYAAATGGDVFTEFTRDAIEQAYARITEQSRNQYTLGYTTGGVPSSNFRSIEVRINKPDLRVFARDGYYPLPPARK